MGVLSSLSDLFGIFGFLVARGGWIFLVLAGLYVAWLLFVEYKQIKFLKSTKWIFLTVDIPKENEQTFLAVEQIFAQLHAIHVNYTFGEKYFHGQVVLWISMEIVSFGGQIKYIFKVPERYRNLFESAFYAHYPDAEIQQVEDYINNVPNYDPKTSYYDVWGAEFKLKKEDAYPIRTYRAFEHQASEVIVDPLAGVLEALSSCKPYEFMAAQFMIRPVDEEWKEDARELVKELKGEKKEKPKKGFLGSILEGVFSGLTGIFEGATVGEAQVSPSVAEYEPPSMMMHLSPGEKDIIAAIEASLGKIGFKVKIRLMYLAPKDKFDKNKRNALVGSFRQFDDNNLNGLKPDTKKTWTGIHFKFSQTLETPFISFLVNRRKRRLLMFYKSRSFTKGFKPFIFNIEELATVFHFPLVTVKAPQLTKTEIKKGEAPLNLPVSQEPF
ncbi:MAG: hypothetical protein HY397_03260 [Candidatus Doudnabacteria bacterium]|nr:hypothetical protein [Candidatus Doudnabacteria bacterium]